MLRKSIIYALISAVFFPVGLFAQGVFPGGRIAISSDGNYHDRDDIAATALSIALLAKADLQDNLVYYGHSDHIWDTHKKREEEMRVSSEETAKLYGGFDKSAFHNAKSETTAAVNALTEQIDASSKDDILWLIGAGPMEVIGKAIQKSDTTQRKYVYVISHSKWNNRHAARDHGGYDFKDFEEMGVNPIQIKDQNAGTDRPYEEYGWMRDADDPKLNWLWKRGVLAGKKKFDPSDAGMVYWLITGGPDGGDEKANPEKFRKFLTK